MLPCRDDNGQCGGRRADLECLYIQRGVLSGPPLVSLIGDRKKEVKFRV